MATSMLEEYFECQKKYQEKYGTKTIVFFMVGHFYEIYGVDNETEKLGLVCEVCEILGLQVTRNNKKILHNSLSNPLKAGMPTIALEKRLSTLLDNFYTVVIVDQVTPPPNVKREVTNIYSPGTNLDTTTPNNNYILSIYIEQEAPNLYSIGNSVIDVSTGKAVCYESYSKKDDQNYSLDETFRFIQTYNPSEIIITSRDLSVEQSWMASYLELNSVSSCKVHWKLNDVPKEYYKLEYQKQFLSKIYSKFGMLSVIEYIDLENSPNALISFIVLLQFVYDYNERLIYSIHPPEIWDDCNHLILVNNAISQLNLSGGKRKTSSMLNIINFTKTAIGNRLLKDRLLNPIINPDELEHRYSLIDYFITNTQKMHFVGNSLHEITDIERLYRKMSMKLLKPCDINDIHNSYTNIIDIYDAIKDTPLQTISLSDDVYEKFKSFQIRYTEALDLNETYKYSLVNITGNFFNKGYNTNLDTLDKEIVDCMDFFEILANKLSNFIEPNSEFIKVGKTDTEGYFLQTTALRFKNLTKNFSIINMTIGDTKHKIELDDLVIEKNRAGNTVKIKSELMKTISEKIINARDELIKTILSTFSEFQAQLYDEFREILARVVKFVGVIDVIYSAAQTAIKYNYCKPKLQKGERSQFSAVGLRHGIIERLDESTSYVPHDITLDGDNIGKLIYGINCSGKSSCMKSIGIAICLAQAGFYVPASEFTFTPYKYLLTRIIGNDNLFKGLSSFAVEMTELRSIIKRANKYSMVLGDEICHGTETISAISIVSASVITLEKQKANFVFATHLHQLSNMTRITSLKNVSQHHLSVKVDNNDKLIYERKLLDGPGTNLYGIEVAKAMGLDTDFIKLSHTIRKEILDINGNLLSAKQSKYNNHLYIDKCQVCKKPAEDTHHIKPQENADDNNFIGSIHKNTKSNLVPLCKECHMNVHNPPTNSKRLNINGYILTDEGIQLDYWYGC